MNVASALSGGLCLEGTRQGKGGETEWAFSNVHGVRRKARSCLTFELHFGKRGVVAGGLVLGASDG